MIETLITAAVFIVILMLVIPIIIYLSAKLGAYGFLKGKRRFELDHTPTNEEKENGSKSEEKGT